MRSLPSNYCSKFWSGMPSEVTKLASHEGGRVERGLIHIWDREGFKRKRRRNIQDEVESPAMFKLSLDCLCGGYTRRRSQMNFDGRQMMLILDHVRQIRAKEVDIYFRNLPLLIDLRCANPREMIDRERKISLLATTTISCDRPDAFPTRQMTLNVDDATHAADVELIDSLPGRVLDQFRDHVYSPAYIRTHPSIFLDRDGSLATRPSIPPIGIESSDELHPDSDEEDFIVETDPSDEMYPDPDNNEEFHAEGELQQSDTIWQDPGITSLVLVGTFRISTKVTVQCIEFVKPHGMIPSIWPNPRVPTAFVLNLGSNYDDIDPKTGKMYTVDFLIKNHDNDSWKSDGSGTETDKPTIRFHPDEPPLICRRARECVARAVDRYDLDPASRDAIFAAQQDTRRREGTTAEDITAGFFDIVDKKHCPAVDSAGKPCQGRPKLMPKKEISRGHNFWVACDGWRKDFKENHRTYSIPDYVNEKMLMKLFAGEPIADSISKDTPPCTMIVPSRTGFKQRTCPHTHIVNGRVVTRSATQRYLCQVRWTIYVPEDASIRKALLVHKPHVPHRHPMPALVKISLDVKEKYQACIGTVATQTILGGKIPSEYSPALANRRFKTGMVQAVKSKKYPAGLGIAGAFQLFLDDQKKPFAERYVHCCRTTDDGGILVITGVPFLIELLDDPGVRAFDDDTTFKRVAGEMNEWELALFFKAVQRALTAIRAYTNRSMTDFYELMFDELQRIKKVITSKVFGMKRFVPGGNLLAMNADMEAAQVLGVARSIMKTNDPEYSGILNDTPASVAATAIHDFKGMVSAAQYNRLMDFMYIDSKEHLDDFSQFVKDLGVKKIQDWWAHKEMNDWIIPCLVKSQSNILPEDWDSTPATTNTGETQHHWTNAMTGIKLSLVEAIESARELDERTAREIEASMKNGILPNRQNEAYHRTARGLQRQTKAAQKALAQEKELREQLKTAKVSAGGSSTKRGRNTNASCSVIVSASSTGRVKTVPAIAASPSAILSIDDLNDSLLQPDIAPPPDLAPLDAMPAVTSTYADFSDLATTCSIYLNRHMFEPKTSELTLDALTVLYTLERVCKSRFDRTDLAPESAQNRKL
ncbi:hypothetical protein K438DRAFT_1781221 [Mycena galopus ATCC 62051]|nr:hypothetical protein K438DRAFT_1781221 [Mycena galopus ATCC 62051]